LTKIKIIGNPGKQNVDALKKWLEKSLKKFNLFPQEIYFIFIKDIQQLERIYRRFTNIFETLGSRESLLTKAIIFDQQCTALIPKNRRKKKNIPIILIKQNSKISESDLLDEVAHLKEEEINWQKTKIDALNLLIEDCGEIWDTPRWLSFFLRLKSEIFDFFSSELICQHRLVNEVLSEKRRILNIWLKEFFPYAQESRIDDFNIVMTAAFGTTLPPSYPQKEDEEKLEKMVINHIYQIGMEPLYRKVKSIVAKLESPPNVVNIYKVGSEIIELAQEFLSK
jgi:hypothetical protein